MTHSLRTHSSRALTAWIASTLVAPTVAASEIRSHPDARGENRPGIHQSANGTPVVEITTPGTDGVSHNVYQQLDVDKAGVVFNNGRQTSATELAGQIGANPALVGGTADLILNEVRAASPSQLAGYLEIGGNPADLVVANPAGITCNGCGFINAERAMLTTGRPLFEDERWTGLDVREGRIRIEGDGMDASRTAEADLLARAIEINAGIWADHLDVTTGIGDFDREGQLIESAAAATASPEWGIDTARLGGMYANKIRLVANEHGVGVRNDGTLAAGTEGMAVTADGKLVNNGTVASAGSAAMQAETIVNPGEMHAEGGLALDAAQAIDNRDGRIVGQADVTVKASTIDNRTGQTLAGGTLRLSADAGILNEGGLSFGEGGLSMVTPSMSGDGQWLSDGDIEATIRGDHRHQGEMAANGNLTLSVEGRLANQGRLTADGEANVGAKDVDNRATGEIAASRLDLAAEDRLDNHGLVDGGEVHVTATTIENTVTGRIYGDYLSVTADHLLNLGDDTSAATLAARSRLHLAVDKLENRYEALVFSAGDMRIEGHDDAFAGHLVNEGATIEALGNLSVAADRIDNLNAGLVTAQVDEPPVQESWIQLRGSQRTFDAADCTSLYHENVWCQGYPHEISDFTWFQTTAVTSHTEVVETHPATLRAGGNMTLDGGTLRNRDSQMIAGDSLLADLDDLDNRATQGRDITRREGTASFTTVESCGTFGSDHCREWHGTSPYRPAPEYGTPYDLPTVTYTDQAGANPSVSTIPGASANSPSTSPTLPNASLFRIRPDNPNTPLIETDPRFASYRHWYGSNAMLDALSRDPAYTQKRLGDGFYEQSLVRQQVIEQTGQRRLAGFADDETQFRALIDAGIALGKDLELVPGVRLQAEQLAQLTADIVWLEEQDVSIDGQSREVLVPRLHLADGPPRPAGNSGRIAARQLEFAVDGIATNRGDLAARDTLTLSANRIENLGGTIEANRTQLAADTDIQQRGGEIRGQRALSLAAGRDITVAADTRHDDIGVGTNRFSRDQIVDRSRIALTGDGELTVTARRDLTLQAAEVTHDGDGTTTLAAGRDLRLTTATKGQDESIAWDSDNRLVQGTLREVGAVIDTQSDLELIAGRDLSARAANIDGGDGTVTLTARRDIQLADGEATRHWEEAHRLEDDSWASSTVAISHETANDHRSQASRLSGGAVRLSADQDIVVQGSHVDALHDLSVLAGGDIRLLAGEERHEESHFSDKQRSGFTTSGYNRSRSTFSREEQRVQHVASSLHSRQGDVTLLAGLAEIIPADGGAVVVDGSRVSADAGRLDLAGQQILLTTTQDSTRTTAARLKRKNTWAFATGLPEGAKDSLDTERRQLTANGSTLSGREGVSLLTNGLIDVTAAQLESSDGGVDINGGQVHIRTARDQLSATHDESHEKTGVSWRDLTGMFTPGQGVGYETSAEQVDSESTLAPATINGRHVAIRSMQDDIDLTAVRIEASGDETEQAGVRIDAAGDLYFGTVTTETFHRRDETHEDLAWQGAEGEGRYNEQIHYNRLNAERVKLRAGDRVTADITSHEPVEILARAPGMDWLRALRDTPSLTDQVDWQAIEEAHEHWSYDEQGLTPAAATVVSVAVAYLTAGAGAGIVNAAAVSGAASTSAGAIAAGMAQAATTNLATQAALAALNNEGNLSQAINDMDGTETVKQILASMLTAGIDTAYSGDYGVSQFSAKTVTGCVSSKLMGKSCKSGALETAALTSAQWVGHALRKHQIESSKRFPGICDQSGKCLSNISGKSAGIDGDNVKIGGGRMEISKICDIAPVLCADPKTGRVTNKISSRYKDSRSGTIIIPDGLKLADGQALTIENISGQLPRSPLGGIQGSQGILDLFGIGKDYKPGSFADILVESFAGPHDWLNSSHYYGADGNISQANGIWGMEAWN
ncbi:two-partner secretion domain-containing protein, partial [Guyparkeria halopsychrophila]|uniref:two-partner secretion domain-containing protein n=1 Tax=Guyparkeria halopsychrophila TaxID=3139421 RepID=UPI0037C98341